MSNIVRSVRGTISDSVTPTLLCLTGCIKKSVKGNYWYNMWFDHCSEIWNTIKRDIVIQIDDHMCEAIKELNK